MNRGHRSVVETDEDIVRTRHQRIMDKLFEQHSARVPLDRRAASDTNARFQNWVVADALLTLSDEHREVLLECFYQGSSVAEAAALLGISTDQVKSRCHFALRALRLALAEKGVGSG